jgi:type I restriction enzyme, S subunit
MSSFQSQKGYKQTEIGRIPEDWQCIEIGQLNPFITSGSRGWAQFYSEHGDPFIRITNMSRDSISLDLSDLRYVKIPDESSEGKRTQLYNDDLLISITADIGIISHVGKNLQKPAYINQHIALVRFEKKKVSSRFVSYFLAHENSQKWFRGGSDQGAKAGMNLVTVGKIRVALPPLSEQKAIAQALSDTDALIGSLEQLIAKKRHIKQGAMQELLTGKRRLQGFINCWDEKTFGEIFDYRSTATNSRSDLTSDGDTYYIHYGDIHTRFHSHLNFNHDHPPKIKRQLCENATLLQDGDWIMADASEDFDGVGKSIEISGLDNSIAAVAGLHTFVLRERTETFAPGFKGHLGNLKSLHDEFLRVATGMKVFGISKTALKELTLPIPPREEQKEIATILSDMDTAIAVLEDKLTKTRQLKQGMMHELLTGRIRLVERAQP